jgi:hypothetical protein
MAAYYNEIDKGAAEIGFPLGKGSPARVARLRGYGNAISPVPAEAFIRAAQEAMSAL